MKTQPAREPGDLSEEEVAAFLRHEVDFFSRHPALLTLLRLPHLRAGTSTVSLVERQVDLLRDQKREADTQLRDFVAVARDNTQLNTHIHQLACALISASSLQAVIDALDRSLRESFGVQEFTLVLLRAPVPTLASARLRFATLAEATACGLDTVLAAGAPRCGNLRDSQRDWLFPAHPGAIASVALVPLAGAAPAARAAGNTEPAGLLALGSPDPARYHPGMSTDFLTRIAQLLAAALAAAG